MIEGFSLGNYLLLVEYTGRLFREGKAVISGELARVFERLGESIEKADACDPLPYMSEIVEYRYDVFESVWQEAHSPRKMASPRE